MVRLKRICLGDLTDETGPESQHLYVVQEQGGACKVGISRNALLRRGYLQTGNHRRLHLIAVFAADDRHDAILAEAATLKHFAQYRLSGEWLDVAPAAIVDFILEGFVDG